MIRHAVKLFAFVIVFTISHMAFANSQKILVNYSDLFSALAKGDSVRAIMTLNKCTSSSNSTDTNDAIAGMNFTNFNKYQILIGNQQKNIIATSINMLVKHSKFGPVYNYVRLRVFEDNSVEIFSEFLDPKTYTQLGSTSLNCRLSNGSDQNGITLYDS